MVRLNKAKHICVIAATSTLLTLFAPSAQAEEPLPTPISDWYEALRQSDEGAFDTLLADTATIELKDIGITQTKNEFIQALDEWSELNGNAIFLTRLKAASENNIVVDVCYRFDFNEMQMQEAFLVDGNLITKSIQEKVSDSCPDF